MIQRFLAILCVSATCLIALWPSTAMAHKAGVRADPTAPYGYAPLTRFRIWPPGAYACDARASQWVVGNPATPFHVKAARKDSGARHARVIRAARGHPRDVQRDRLTVEVNRHGRIARVRCW